MDASYKIQRGIHVHLIQFFMCPEFWVHIRLGRLFLCLVIIFAECVSGTKAGDAEAHDCNKVHNTHWLSPPFQWILFRVSM